MTDDPGRKSMQGKWTQDGYIKAYKFAAQTHRGQVVPGTDLPYVMHLSFVSMEIIAALNTEQGCNENLAVQCALLHDVVITLGLITLFNRQVDLLVVTALLTIAGYSINDTIVIYDRVRENSRGFKKLSPRINK